MGKVQYDIYYKPPWATSKHFEERHKQVYTEIGTSLKGRTLGIHIIYQVMVWLQGAIIITCVQKIRNSSYFYICLLFIEIGPLTYPIMYGLLFYSVSEDQINQWQTPTTDYLLIKKVSSDIITTTINIYQISY